MESMLYQGHRCLGGTKHSGGCEIVEDEPRSGRTCMSKMEEKRTKVRALMRSYQHLTVKMIGTKLNLNHKTVHDILTEEMFMLTL
jgi:hypothetical protein